MHLSNKIHKITRQADLKLDTEYFSVTEKSLSILTPNISWDTNTDFVDLTQKFSTIATAKNI